MNELNLRNRVAIELELLSAEGADLHTDSPSATINLFSPEDSILRITDFALQYLDLQAHVTRGGLAAVVTAGPPAVGKSTELKEEGFDTSAWRNIDADLVKKLILRRAIAEGLYGEYLSWELADGRSIRPLELASLVHRESSAVVNNLTATCLRLGENVVIQGTLAWSDQPDKILQALDSHGYDELTILNIEADVSTAIEQSLQRWWRGRTNSSNELGGRFVPSGLISALYLPGGLTKCSTNAQFMFEFANLPRVRIVTTTTLDGSKTRHERLKIEGDELPEVKVETR